MGGGIQYNAFYTVPNYFNPMVVEVLRLRSKTINATV